MINLQLVGINSFVENRRTQQINKKVIKRICYLIKNTIKLLYNILSWFTKSRRLFAHSDILTLDDIPIKKECFILDCLFIVLKSNRILGS